MKTTKIYLFLLSFVILGLVSCNFKHVNEELESLKAKKELEEKNIELVKQQIKIFDQQDYDSFRNLFAEDFKLFMGSSKESVNFEDGVELVKMFYSGFPDYSHGIENIFASNDFVVVQLLFTGTHRNSFLDIPPTNNKIEYKGIIIYSIEDAKIKEMHAVEDDLTMLTQLGLELK